jgi:hypothetical protein
MTDPHVPTRAEDCLLTIALPKALEEEMLDVLSAHRDLVPGFTLVQAQGVGHDAPLTNTLERVEGRARRVLVHVAMAQADVDLLLSHLRNDFPNAHVAFWVTHLTHFGRLA